MVRLRRIGPSPAVSGRPRRCSTRPQLLDHAPFQRSTEADPDCLPAAEARAYLRERRQGQGGTDVPPETTRVIKGIDAGRFLIAAWSANGTLPDGADYMRVDTITLRTRPDIPGFARVHFGSTEKGITCGFRRAVIVSTERMQAGISGVPKFPPVRQGNSLPGLTEEESDSLRLITGLANQAARGTQAEQDQAVQSLQQLSVPPARAGQSDQAATPPVARPTYGGTASGGHADLATLDELVSRQTRDRAA